MGKPPTSGWGPKMRGGQGVMPSDVASQHRITVRQENVAVGDVRNAPVADRIQPVLADPVLHVPQRGDVPGLPQKIVDIPERHQVVGRGERDERFDGYGVLPASAWPSFAAPAAETGVGPKGSGCAGDVFSWG